MDIIQENTVCWKLDAKQFLREWDATRTPGQNFSYEKDDEFVLQENSAQEEFDDYIDDVGVGSAPLVAVKIDEELKSYEDKQRYNRNDWAHG